MLPEQPAPSPRCQLTSPFPDPSGGGRRCVSWCKPCAQSFPLHLARTELPPSCSCLSSPQYWRQVYLITVLAMILAVFFAQIHPSYLTQQWQRLRSLIFCSVSGYGIIPTIHWVWLHGGLGAPIVQVKGERKEITSPLLLPCCLPPALLRFENQGGSSGNSDLSTALILWAEFPEPAPGSSPQSREQAKQIKSASP